MFNIVLGLLNYIEIVIFMLSTHLKHLDFLNYIYMTVIS